MRWLVCLFALVGCDVVFGLKAPLPDSTGSVDAPRPDGEPIGCPANYDLITQQTASRYRVELSTTRFSQAAADCANDAPGLTHLIVLSNREEWLGLLTSPPTFLFDDTWIGASDRVSNNMKYRWVTGEDTAAFAVPAIVGSEPWEGDQPDSVGDCGELRGTGGLHSETCDSSSNYICECDGRPDVPANY